MSKLTEKAVEIIAYLDKNQRAEHGDTQQPTVAALLSQSRAHHELYRRSLRHRVNGVTLDGDPVAAASEVATTARLRAQAEILDPAHVDPAWAEDLAAKFPHEALVLFYDDEIKYYVPPIYVPPVPPVPDVTPEPVLDPKDEQTDADTRQAPQIVHREAVKKTPRVPRRRTRAV